MISYQKSFTLVELLVVIGIVLLLSALILPDFRVGERQFALQRSAHKLAQDIRRAQEMAMSAKEFSCPTGSLTGYGAGFFNGHTDYYLLAQCDANYLLETLLFEKKVKIQDLAYYKDGSWFENRGALWFYFVPPDPITNMMAGAEKIKITLALETDLTKTKTITLNKAGLINVEE